MINLQENSDNGLTPEEESCMNSLVNFWNKFVELPVQHSNDAPEVCKLVHDLQYRMAVRIARRDYPDFWTNEEQS